MAVTEVLQQADIFYELTPEQLELVASICTERNIQQGEMIFNVHTNSDELYVVAEGEVEIQVDPNFINVKADESLNLQTIATLRRGQSFGEIALLDEGRRSAAAKCGSPTGSLLILPREKLMSLCETYPKLGYRLMYNLAVDLSMKIRNADLKIREQLLWMQRHQESESNKKPDS